MPYTRLTVLGSIRKAELVLPDDEPLGSLIPPVMNLLGEQPQGGQELAVTTVVGRHLDLGESLAAQEVEHGAMIRITTIDEAPTPPQVADVTDAVAIARTTRSDRWNAKAANACVAVTVGALALCSSMLAQSSSPSLSDLPTQLALLAAALLATGAIFLAHKALTAAAAALGVAAFGVLVPLVPHLVPAASLSVTILNLAAAGWLVLGLVAGVGANRGSVLVGAGIGVAVAVATVVAMEVGVAEITTQIFTVLVGLVTLGVLPGVALALSGLTSYDDQTAQGTRPERRDIANAIEEGFATLTWAVIAIALPTLMALVALAGSTNPWAMWLAVVVAIAVWLRARIMPLIPQRVALYLTSGLAMISYVLNSPALSARLRIVLLVVAAVTLILTALFHPREVTAAKLRRYAEIAELLLLITVIPLALGALGIYSDLLEVFR